jgi:molybdate transport system ATP-binding protein
VAVRERLDSITLRAASVRLGRRWVLRDVALELNAGERWWLQGPNGAGKTVLLKLLRGDVWPTPTGREQRRYRLQGGETLDQPLLVASRIAYLGPERQDRYERHGSTLDVSQVVLTGFDDSDLPLQGATPSQRRRIRSVLRAVGLEGLAARRFLALSYGQRRRVLLARAVVRRPDVLLLDEVLNGLDAAGRRAFLRALRHVASSRTAWILSSHRAEDRPPGVTHVASISHGHLELVPVERGAAAGGATPRAAPATSRAVPGVGAGAKVGTAPRVAGATGDAGDCLLSLRNAAVYRDERVVIGRFDWDLRTGEHWSIRGNNGAGKSTLVALLYGDLWPALGGQLLRRWSTADEWKARVGLVSPELQARYAATGCTVEQIVTSGLHASIGLNLEPTPRERRRVRRQLLAWGLAALAPRRAREISYGQLRLALVARAFIRARRLYLLDEPFDGLDTEARALVQRRLAAAVAAGATVVLATHHAVDVPAWVNNTLRLRCGRAPVKAAGPPRTR